MARSLTFRLGILYVILFLTSMLTLFGAAYWIGVARPMQQEAERVVGEAGRLVAVDRDEGRGALIAALDARQRLPGPRHAFHALVGADGRALSANLPSWPDERIEGWRLLDADLSVQGAEEDFTSLSVERRLPDGARLIVGRDVEDIDDRDELFSMGSAWLILIAALLAVGSSFAMSAAVGRRIEAVTRTARRVMAGSMTERIPLSGTGDDFDELADTLNLMLGRIEESVEAVRRVSDNVAHELRTPLARLHADLDELRVANGAKERERLTEQAIAEAARLQAIFDALLRIARIESGRHFAGFARVDLSALLADAIELHSPDVEAHGQTLESAIADGLAIEGDRNLIFQMVSNLLDNAVKYAGEGGRILVAARAKGGRIRIEIADSGPGIAPAYRERVKERFFRVPETAGAPGTGLGLALVAAIVALHKGVLEIGDAEPGTKVVVVFEAGVSRNS